MISESLNSDVYLWIEIINSKQNYKSHTLWNLIKEVFYNRKVVDYIMIMNLCTLVKANWCLIQENDLSSLQLTNVYGNNGTFANSSSFIMKNKMPYILVPRPTSFFLLHLYVPNQETAKNSSEQVEAWKRLMLQDFMRSRSFVT